MNRRETVLALLATVAWPLASLARQADKIWRVGFLQAISSANDMRFEAFRRKLRELGHVEGKTIAIDYVSAEGKYERLPALAADLVRRKADAIVTSGGTPAAFDRGQTTKPDRVSGLSPSLLTARHPGDRMTGARRPQRISKTS